MNTSNLTLLTAESFPLVIVYPFAISNSSKTNKTLENCLEELGILKKIETDLNNKPKVLIIGYPCPLSEYRS